MKVNFIAVNNYKSKSLDERKKNITQAVEKIINSSIKQDK